MNHFSRRLFLLLAPVSVPAYLIYLAFMSVAAGCHAIVVEQTLQTLLRRPVVLSGLAFWLATPILILLTPPIIAVHAVIWLGRQLIEICTSLGRWQAVARSPWVAAPIGAGWLVLFAWTLLVCIDVKGGYWVLGRGLPGAEHYDQAVRKRWTLAQLTAQAPDSVARRQQLIASLTNGPLSRVDFASGYREDLSNDEVIFAYLPFWLRLRLLGVPWCYRAAFETSEGVEHCEFLVGPLLLGLVLLIRWPGLHPRNMPASIAMVLFVLRVGASWGALLYTLGWHPAPPVMGAESAADLGWLAPAGWFGVESRRWVPPQWWTLNAALWLILAGLLAALWKAAAIVWPRMGAPSYYSTFLAIRLLQRKRIAFFSMGAVTLCVAMELIVISVMGGFLDTIVARAKGLMGDLVMDAGIAGFPFYDEFIDIATQRPDVVSATPVVHAYGILRFPETQRTKEVQVRGVRLTEFGNVNDFARPNVLFYNTHYPGMTSFKAASQPFHGYDPGDGRPVLPAEFEQARADRLAALDPAARREETERWERLPHDTFPGPGVFAPQEDGKPGWSGRELPGIIVGRDIMFTRHGSAEHERDTRYPRGTIAQVSLLPVTRRGKPLTDSIPAPLFRYVDDSRTGVFEIDSRTVYVDFEYLQDLVLMSPQKRAEAEGRTPARCTSIQFKLAPDVPDKRAVARALEALWDEFRARREADADDQSAMANVQIATSEELQREFIAAIQKEKVLVVIMFGIISVVAVLLVLCIFYMIVVEKTRDIGIIKSVGGSAHGVAAIFLTYGAAVGIVGATLGTLLGRTFVLYINEFQDWLARINPNWRIWSPETYSFDRIPSSVKTDEMLWIAGLAVVASILGAVIPAIRAARTWPVEALRYE